MTPILRDSATSDIVVAMIADISISEKSYGAKNLYKNLRFSINDSEKIGVVGRNGVGKSTLLGILAGTDSDYTGEIIFQRGIRLVSTRQEHHGLDEMTTLQYILGDLPEYADLSRVIEYYPAHMGDNSKKIAIYSDALERFSQLNYYHIEGLIIEDLKKMQIDEKRAHDPLANLSGGQKRLVEVVKVMHSNAHLALVDEPTNHMDFVAKAAFIEWMKSASEAMLIITHDRDVLREVDRIVEIKDGQAVVYDGNYDFYLRQNSFTTANAMHEHEVVQRQIANTKDKIIQFRRLKEKARDPDTIKQFKRREQLEVSRLEELVKIEKPSFWIDKDSASQLGLSHAKQYEKYKTKNIRINHGNDDSGNNRLLVEVRDLSLGYEQTTLFGGVSFQLRESERVELRGRNGAGKTTLIKALLASAGLLKLENIVCFSGTIEVDPKVRIGVYEQEIDPRLFDKTLYSAIEFIYLSRKLSISDTKIRQLMSDYLFEQTDGHQRVSSLSGGQKARLQLIEMLSANPNLLILDEPTNHLDLPSIEELETALGRYQGSILYVSHDSYFQSAIGGVVVKIATGNK